MTQTERPESLTFFSGLATGLAGLALTCLLTLLHPHTAAFAPITPPVLALFAATALFGGLGSLCFFRALRLLPAAGVAQFHYTQLVTGALVAYLFFAERLTLSMLTGALIIVAAGIWTATTARSA